MIDADVPFRRMAWALRSRFGRWLRLPGRRVGDGRIDVLGNVDAMFIGNLGTRSCRIQNEHFLRCDVVSRGLTDPVADIEFE